MEKRGGVKRRKGKEGRKGVRRRRVVFVEQYIHDRGVALVSCLNLSHSHFNFQLELQ